MIYPLASRLRVIADAGDRTPNLVRQLITKLGIADNVATPLFTVTTTNEAGSADGGAYFCQVTALIAHAATSATTNAAAKAFQARFTRAMIGAGSGALSAVTEDHDDTAADTDPATRNHRQRHPDRRGKFRILRFCLHHHRPDRHRRGHRRGDRTRGAILDRLSHTPEIAPA